MGGTPHANTTHFPNDKSLELVELGTGSNLALRRYETRGGGCCRERERAYPVPSPRGTLPTWIPSGDDLNLVHNRQTIQPGAGEDLLGFFFGAVSCLSVVPGLLHLPLRFYRPLPRPGWFFVPIRSVTNHKSI